MRQTPQTCTLTRISLGPGLWDVTVHETQGVLGGRRRMVQRPGPHAAVPAARHAAAEPEFTGACSPRRLERRGDELSDVCHKMHIKAFEDIRRVRRRDPDRCVQAGRPP